MHARNFATRKTASRPAPDSSPPRALQILLRIFGTKHPVDGDDGTPEGGALTSPRTFVEELKILGLHGRPFTWEEYRDRLEEHLGIKIVVTFVEDDTELHTMLAHAHTPGLVLRDESTGNALVLVSAALDELVQRAVVWHELSHVAGGHPVPPALLIQNRATQDLGEDSDDFWVPKRSVLGPPAPRDHDLCERDARLRAELALQTAHSGRDPHRADESFFLLDGR